MFKLNLNQANYAKAVKTLLNKWNDGSKITSPLVIVKVSDAFTMYHQIVSDDLTVENQAFDNLHPVLINDLETGFNVLLALDTAGRILHGYVIENNGRLHQDDSLLKIAHKNRDQEYLDYFYCINVNIYRHLNDGADSHNK